MAARGIVCQRGIEASEVSAKVCKQQLKRSSAKALSVFPVRPAFTYIISPYDISNPAVGTRECGCL